MPDEDLSSGLFAATVCRDGPFPWQPDTPVADRPALLAAAIKRAAGWLTGPVRHVGGGPRQRDLLPAMARSRRRRRARPGARFPTSPCSP